ncbi:MAG TPA: hypothetical protein VMM12_02420 [Longimicrobiales bacterium]|nr:hypothetical protein [Longimicrobiales bacterium]
MSVLAAARGTSSIPERDYLRLKAARLAETVARATPGCTAAMRDPGKNLLAVAVFR